MRVMSIPVRTRRWATTLTGAALAATALAACAKSSTPLSGRAKTVRATDTAVKFTQCGAACTGDIDGAKYSIKLPAKWNGTLLLYSHGYRFAEPGPPDFSPVSTSAQISSTDSDGSGSDPLSQQLLSQGYALAGSSYKSNGWAVADGVAAGVALHKKFLDVVGTPRRTYVWGDSLGGLITEVIAERNPSWVDGAAPMCGAVAGPNLNFDAALDVAFAVKALIDPELKLTGYASAEEADANWKHAEELVVKAAGDTAKGGTAKVLFTAALSDAPAKTRTYDGHDIASQVKATVEALLTALAFGTAGRYELEQRVGGNPSDNSKADYTNRVSESEAALIKTVGGDVAKFQAALEAQPRVTADASARDAFEKLGDTTGDLHAPTLTMHTEADPLVLVSNESVLAARVRSHGDSPDLVQLYVMPPATYPESSGAPYGAGHCNFTDQQRTALIGTLDSWVRSSVYPVPNGVAGQFGDGLDPAFSPPAWPSGATG
jgi:pimeloyl-ACP methyl ester carboxylesterase